MKSLCLIFVTSAGASNFDCALNARSPSFGSRFAISDTERQSCPEPRAVRAWQDLKFGLFLHWGIYSQLGVYASWPLCWDARSWSNPNVSGQADMLQYREHYWNLSTSFDPVLFDPDVWMSAVAAAGMKYVIMTAKHHDGFAMYDTAFEGSPGQGIFGVMGPDCPAKRDIYGELVQAARSKDLKVGAYFSKADWHARSFWDPALGFAIDRWPNYNISERPDKWKTFQDFHQAQLTELQDKYDPDILWLDAGWVGAATGKSSEYDLRILDIAKEARKKKPTQLVVNRVGKVAEDFLSPENPEPWEVFSLHRLMPQAWGSTMTLGDKFAYSFNDIYKSAGSIVRSLIGITATGGFMSLDIGPMADGRLPREALQRLAEIGAWMRVNSESIYSTRPLPPYALNVTDGNSTHEFATVRGPSGDVVYVSLIYPQFVTAVMPESLRFPFVLDLPGGADGSWPMGILTQVTILAEKPVLVDWAWKDGYLSLHSLPTELICHYATVFKLQYGELHV